MRRVSQELQALERIAIYGDPKSGKTRLATSLPWGPYWGEKAVYIAVDPSSEFLRPVLHEHRDRIAVFKPERRKDGWIEEFTAMATMDWQKEVPGAKVLIWDTMSETSRMLLQEYANLGIFTDSHAAEIGKRGTLSWHTAPAPGDYGAAQNSVGFLLTHLWQQPMHVIVLFHAKWVEPKEGSPEGLVGGPDVSGGAMVRALAGKFDSCLRMEMTMDPKTRTPRFLVHSTNRGIWKAGFRTGRPKQQLATTFPLDEDPSKFWAEYTADIQGEGGEKIWKGK